MKNEKASIIREFSFHFGSTCLELSRIKSVGLKTPVFHLILIRLKHFLGVLTHAASQQLGKSIGARLSIVPFSVFEQGGTKLGPIYQIVTNH